MAFIERENRRPCIDLAGPEGNAFSLLGLVVAAGKELGWTKGKVKVIQDEMMSGDYKNLVEVFERELGDCFDIVLPENGL